MNEEKIARERIEMILDDDFIFRIISTSGHELYEGMDVPSGAIVTGIGEFTSGLYVVANDATVKGEPIFLSL